MPATPHRVRHTSVTLVIGSAAVHCSPRAPDGVPVGEAACACSGAQSAGAAGARRSPSRSTCPRSRSSAAAHAAPGLPRLGTPVQEVRPASSKGLSPPEGWKADVCTGAWVWRQGPPSAHVSVPKPAPADMHPSAIYSLKVGTQVWPWGAVEDQEDSFDRSSDIEIFWTLTYSSARL